MLLTLHQVPKNQHCKLNLERSFEQLLSA